MGCVQEFLEVFVPSSSFQFFVCCLHLNNRFAYFAKLLFLAGNSTHVPRISFRSQPRVEIKVLCALCDVTSVCSRDKEKKNKINCFRDGAAARPYKILFLGRQDF
jgi:hypothetical protein